MQHLKPDAVLFVGDLADGDLRLTRRITRLPFPVAVILGNHDRGRDRSGGILEQQVALLGDLHCAWRTIQWPELALTIVGARPCSAGGGFHLSKAVEAVYGLVSLETSADRIVQAAAEVPADQPLIVMAHCGPSGLGSDATSPCGRDWKTPAVDWGDQDLALKHEHPSAEVIAHPECQQNLLDLADFIGSTSKLLNYAEQSSCNTFIVLTEPGILHQMQQRVPEKTQRPRF